ncbi:MAG TPA: glyceraldehyde 3-phosphate dehydrogenase NAD-binding domain-containing protein [Vicinamibacterales bacterium]|nr:glyceraldehyde 3-phosphate dehydrogenase NAD-binding domain-containing protein [Vicinamibacterales bacterium]
MHTIAGGRPRQSTRVALNGLGRIGRAVLRALFARAGDTTLELVALNDVMDLSSLIYLLRHDTLRGRWRGQIEGWSGGVILDGRRVDVRHESDPRALPWRALGVDVVIDATGRHREPQLAAKHLDAGALRVLVSAPMPGADATIVFGVNHASFDPARHRIVSNASCTANCLAPLVSVLVQFGWVRGYMTTVHPSTSDQHLVDAPHDDPRRGRAAGAGIIPTSTSATSCLKEVLPAFADTIDGLAYRVPTLFPAVLDLVAQVKTRTTREEVNAAMRAASDRLPRVIGVNDEPLVGSDYVGAIQSATVDARLTTVTDGHQVHVTAWYDNETAFAERLLDVSTHMGNLQLPTPNSKPSVAREHGSLGVGGWALGVDERSGTQCVNAYSTTLMPNAYPSTENA